MSIQTSKKCSECQVIKDYTEFYKTKCRNDGHESYCKQCRNKQISKYQSTLKGRQVNKVAQQRWKSKNKEYQLQYQSERRLENKKKAILYLGNKCNMCNNSFPSAVYDFHHKNSEEKEFHPASILMHKWETIQKELDKCELLCANCHRIKHHGEK